MVEPPMGAARQRSARRVTPALVGALALWSSSAVAQPGPPPLPPRLTFEAEGMMGEPLSQGIWEPRVSLRQHVGVARAADLLLAAEPSERLRGIERLAATASDEAIRALAEGMATGTAIRSDSHARLLGVRALAPHADVTEVRNVLVSVLNSVRPDSPETPLDSLARATAAMALARAGTKDTLTPLLTAVISRGRTGKLAERALRVHRAEVLTPLGAGKRKLAPQVIGLLGDLGDPRAIGLLRRRLGHKNAAIRRAAAIALAQLGDGQAAVHARRWLAKPVDGKAAAKADGKGGEAGRVEDRLAAAEVLMLLDAPDAAQVVAGLLGEASTRAAGLRLAERQLSPALVPTLEAVVKAKVTPPERARATRILATIGGDGAAAALVGLLGVPELATEAASGLARIHGGVAEAGLTRALAAAAAGDPRRLILRAGVVRYLQLGESLQGLEEGLERALGSEDAADRAVGAFGLAVMGQRTVDELLARDEPEVAAAAARAALALGLDGLASLRRRLLAVADEDVTSPTVVLAAPALLIAGGDEGLSTSRLASWAEQGGPVAALAARRLAERDSRLYRSRLRRLLQGTDPSVRLHVALGLGRSPEKDAVSLLVGAYRFETEPLVRRGIVRALSLRGESRRIATLELARDLDPDDTVRALARSALAGRVLPPPTPPAGKEVAWLSLRANSAEGKALLADRCGEVLRADGLSLPFVVSPDGTTLLPGLTAMGDVSVRLAPQGRPGDAATDGARD